jgi:hypothetical protein
MPRRVIQSIVFPGKMRVVVADRSCPQAGSRRELSYPPPALSTAFCLQVAKKPAIGVEYARLSPAAANPRGQGNPIPF